MGGDFIKLSEKKALRKKEQILSSAIGIINQKGYNGATMEDIAAELLMTKGSLYYYFKNKSDLMYQCHRFVLTQAINELEEILNGGGSVKEILFKMVTTHIEYVIEEKETFKISIEPKLFSNLEQFEHMRKLRKNYEGLFDQLILRGIQSGEFFVKEPSTAKMFILGGMNWVQQWYQSNGRLAKEEIIQLYCDYILKLLCNDRDGPLC
ncbi:TetR/AcrR family transcriptional regulator [Bacillus sp. B15-48]|uniref:TetR/AcrR family transcriptional regulator n=1 Tax=Bacillus sp. B15-48 TaxID=1548601 RepID=UPI00194015AD|nr:TetR/AcrR family transcriptional regulator [Bacillus sp. B15-48]MBM4761808.1 TetR family transcriptional regulator [Bacillus sp. B15-48]